MNGILSSPQSDKEGEWMVAASTTTVLSRSLSPMSLASVKFNSATHGEN